MLSPFNALGRLEIVPRRLSVLLLVLAQLLVISSFPSPPWLASYSSFSSPVFLSSLPWTPVQSLRAGRVHLSHLAVASLHRWPPSVEPLRWLPWSVFLPIHLCQMQMASIRHTIVQFPLPSTKPPSSSEVAAITWMSSMWFLITCLSSCASHVQFVMTQAQGHLYLKDLHQPSYDGKSRACMQLPNMRLVCHHTKLVSMQCCPTTSPPGKLVIVPP